MSHLSRLQLKDPHRVLEFFSAHIIPEDEKASAGMSRRSATVEARPVQLQQESFASERDHQQVDWSVVYGGGCEGVQTKGGRFRWSDEGAGGEWDWV